jgi:hypothetical protein
LYFNFFCFLREDRYLRGAIDRSIVIMAAELNFFVQGIKSEKEFADPIRAEVSVQVQAKRRPLAGVYLLLCDVDVCLYSVM